MENPGKLNVRCPDCDCRLVVDSLTGEVLFHQAAEKPPGGGKQFEELLADLDQDRLRAEELFAREVAAHEDRDRLLDEKFQEAMKRAADSPDDEPPPSPFDFD